MTARKKGGRAAERLRVLIVATSTLDEDASVHVHENLPAVEAGNTVAGESVGEGDAPHAVLLDLALRPGAGTIRVVIEGFSGGRMIVPVSEAVSNDRYRLEIDDGGRGVISFGDGAEGATPPASSGAVRASYRVGTGRAGTVSGSTITVLEEHPGGIADVNNPLPATGGADPEAPDELRRGAPTSMRTLDRLISAADYDDFLTGLLGIGKAAGVARSPKRKRRKGERRIVEVKLPADLADPR